MEWKASRERELHFGLPLRKHKPCPILGEKGNKIRNTRPETREMMQGFEAAEELYCRLWIIGIIVAILHYM